MKVIVANSSFIRITKQELAQIKGKVLWRTLFLIFEKTKEDFKTFLTKTFEGFNQTTQLNTLIIHEDKSKTFVSITGSPIRDAKSEVERIVLVFRDVSKLKEIDQMRDEFVSIVSHQIRTPLTSIKWHTELIRDNSKYLPKDLQTSFEFITQSTEKLIDMVNDLLKVSRIDTGRKFEILPSPTNLIQLCQNLIKEYSMVAQKAGVKLNFQYDMNKSYFIMLDIIKFTEALSNIVSNSIKYQSSKVIIKIVKSRQYLQIIISDDGIGIPIEDQTKLFEKFFRASNARNYSGNGLGLYFSKAIIEAHGGNIRFESQVGKGTKFKLTLPIK